MDDFAELAIAAGKRSDNLIMDAIGPESFTFRQFVEKLGQIIGCRRPIINIPPTFGYLAGVFMGLVKHVVVITREEIGGLMAGLLAVDSPPVGLIRLTEWAREHSDCLRRKYASELMRRH